MLFFDDSIEARLGWLLIAVTVLLFALERKASCQAPRGLAPPSSTPTTFAWSVPAPPQRLPAVALLPAVAASQETSLAVPAPRVQPAQYAAVPRPTTPVVVPAVPRPERPVAAAPPRLARQPESSVAPNHPFGAGIAPSVEQRLNDLEANNARLSRQLGELLGTNQSLSQRLETQQEQFEALRNDAEDGRLDGIRSPAQRGFDDLPDDIRTDEPEPSEAEVGADSTFGEGFKWETRDGEYSLVFHNETQIDTRTYSQADSDPVNQFGMYFQRVRAYFNGHLTEPIEYSLSLNKGLGSLDLLDAYLNFNYDNRLQFRMGRFRVPFTYDWYALSNQFLPTPERSVFAVNYGYNRNLAAMIHGEVGDESAEYAVAAANGPRNQYFDYNSPKDLLAYINVRPFEQLGVFPALKHFNVGCSAAYGIQNQAPLPSQFRTSLNATVSPGAIEAAPAFLVLNENVLERGIRSLREIHMAYFYRQLTVMGAWDKGFNSYGFDSDEVNVAVPSEAWHVGVAYFLTGEEIERRTIVEPLRPFDLRSGKRGPGAFEIQARYDDFQVGDEIFTANFADPNLNTDHVRTVDAGINWYLNKFTKVYFDWQHSSYAHPIPYRPGKFQHVSNLFWTRLQIFF